MSIDLSRPSSSCAGEDYDSLLGENSDAAPSRMGSLSQIRIQRDRIPIGDENDDTEEQAQMDLVLNANFDLGMFDYNWSDDTNNIATMNANNDFDNQSPDVGVDTPTNCEEVLLSPTTINIDSEKCDNGLHPQAISSSAECPPITTSAVPSNLSTEDSVKGVKNQVFDGTLVQNPKASIDVTANTQNSIQSRGAATTNSTGNNVEGDSYLLSSQLQELIARQSAAPISRRTASSAPVVVSHPPFLLFDAPIELRANFIASQRAHGFPILDDNNAFHYQHPPQFSQQQLFSPEVHLVDGRHGGIRNKRVKNEREQKRTQKITDLIDQLRDKMEEGGWKVGGTKSKYATLSTCAEYVKHLVKATKEQELALEKTKQDLEAKRRKIEDDNEYQQDPSDPESTISSLTVSSGATDLPPESTPPGDSSNKRRGMPSACDTRKVKIPRNLKEKDSDINEITSTSLTSKSKSTCNPSDKGTLSGESVRHDSHSSEESSKSSCSQTFGGVSSVGAVARGLHCRASRASHPDVIVDGYKKRSTISEATSMDSSFKLDYEEVFVKSSVPQLLATTAGRIVAWNDMFLKVSGLLASDIDSVTIFSLVRQSELVKLFEIVAATLRSGTMLRAAEFSSNQNSRTIVQPKDTKKAQTEHTQRITPQ